MIKMLALSVASLWSLSVMAGTSYKVNTKSSVINWVGSKVGSSHNGTLKLKSGNFVMSGNSVKGSFTFDMSTIKCLDIKNDEYRGKLEGHLKSADFFDVSSHRYANFELTSASKLSDGNHQFKGNLTIKNIKKPITFKGKLTQSGNGSKLKAKATFDRTLFDIKYNSKKFFDMKALGDKLIKDEIKVELIINAMKA